MNTAFTVANFLVMWIASSMMAAIIALRALDCWRAGGGLRAVSRLGVALFLLAVALNSGFWLLRWALVKAGRPEASQWLVEHAGLTLAFGGLASIGVFLTVFNGLWSQARYAGVALAVAAIAGTWIVGLRI